MFPLDNTDSLANTNTIGIAKQELLPVKSQMALYMDSLGRALPMGTEVDHMGVESRITNEAGLVADGSISSKARENRILLRQAMKASGFQPLPSEWWHFNLCSRNEAMQKYQLIK